MIPNKVIPHTLTARYDYLTSIRILDEQKCDVFQAKREEWLTYIKKSVDRVFYIISLLQGKKQLRILELGASPYLITAAIVDLLQMSVTAVSGHDVIWPGQDIDAGSRSRFIVAGDTTYPFQEHLFNVEKDIFPFADETFDLVLCNELIEHLLFNPTHLLCEINRVLIPGGKLILSTQPNILYWRLAVQLFLNMTFEMPYSGNGPYGRHNRLFTPDELKVLAESNGFEVKMIKVQTFREIRSKSKLIHLLRQMTLLADWMFAYVPIKAIQKKAGENITLVCRKKCRGKPCYPLELYGSIYPEWLKAQGIHYVPEEIIVNKWIKR